ncbi:hypothetical protein ILYODFUR_003730 [Ilyodon furcidens]|uniref:Uncharacterized protein n=1 Tax=Ilyodon furcidens TaxID=33524 RepID=A0ABV0TSR8_9TELE
MNAQHYFLQTLKDSLQTPGCVLHMVHQLSMHATLSINPTLFSLPLGPACPSSHCLSPSSLFTHHLPPFSQHFPYPRSCSALCLMLHLTFFPASSALTFRLGVTSSLLTSSPPLRLN